MALQIQIDPETYVPMFVLDQMLMIKECRECYKHYGLHGLHYVVLFGWAASPYQGEQDEAARDLSVFNDVYSDKLYDPIKKKLLDGRDKRHPEMYKNVFVKAAIKAVNTYAKVLMFEQRKFFLEQVKSVQLEATIDFSTSSDYKVKKEMAATQKLMLENVKNFAKAVDEIDARIASTMKIMKLASLNDFILDANGSLGLNDTENEWQSGISPE